jgi:hypothetical protein
MPTEPKGDAGCDPEQPTEHGAREDDPDERGMACAEHPAELHLPRVGEDERDQDDGSAATLNAMT